MRVVWAVPCRYGELGADGLATMIAAGVDRAMVQELPFELGLHIMVKLAASPDEAGTTQTLGFEFRDPFLTPKDRQEYPVEIPPLDPGDHGGLDTTTVIPVFQIFDVTAEGLHELSILVNGSQAFSVPFLVDLVEAPQS